MAPSLSFANIVRITSTGKDLGTTAPLEIALDALSADGSRGEPDDADAVPLDIIVSIRMIKYQII
jgi:hypothetical protein